MEENNDDDDDVDEDGNTIDDELILAKEIADCNHDEVQDIFNVTSKFQGIAHNSNNR